ncbi:MAG: hypothetical protein HZB43_01360 [candidate division Zixibacteria bacterium]|nr:hypothetical protein [candidate division Zixibacteria bacterium]
MSDKAQAFTREQVLQLVDGILDHYAVGIVGVICSERPPDSTMSRLLHCLSTCETEVSCRTEAFLRMSDEGIETRSPMLRQAVRAFRERIAKHQWDQDIATAGGV